MGEPRRPRARSKPVDHDDDLPEHRVLWDEQLLAYAPNGWKTTRRQTTHVLRPQTVDMPVDERRTSSAIIHVKAVPAAPDIDIDAPAPPHLQRARAKLDPRLVILADPESPRAAGFRLLCDNLIARGLPRVLAVSSSAPHEGKTTCALNLAVALAERASAPVLLVDANFFEPALAEIFGIEVGIPTPPVVGFDWLTPYQLAELTPCLHVAALVPSRGPGARLDPPAFEVLIDRLTEAGYGRIIIDAPALDGSAVVARLVAVAEGVLFTVRSGRTTARALRRAVDQLAKGKALGTALMDA